jgi:hypothetical protein
MADLTKLDEEKKKEKKKKKVSALVYTPDPQP